MILRIIVSLLVVIFISTIVFAIIYTYYQKKGLLHGLYTSAMIQTLVGVQDEPDSKGEKFTMIVQSLISYLITAHVIIFAHQYVEKL